MIITVKLINTNITLFCVWQGENNLIATLNNFQLYNTVLFTIVPRLYIRSPELTHLSTESL